MHIVFFLEEPSAEAALEVLLPKIVSDNVSRYFHVFRGKAGLLKKLPSLLKAYRNWLPDDWRIVVLIDEDRENCVQLKAKLEQAALDEGFITKSSAPTKENFQVLNRLAIEELEAWFFGDLTAVRKAYPRVSRNVERDTKYLDPDAIKGGTHESLQFLLKRYYANRLPKIQVAQKIASYMEPSRNRSRSFQVFVEGLQACVGEDGLRNQDFVSPLLTRIWQFEAIT